MAGEEVVEDVALMDAGAVMLRRKEGRVVMGLDVVVLDGVVEDVWLVVDVVRLGVVVEVV